MAFFTNVTDLQAALSACLTVRDWEMLMEAVLIPEERMAMALLGNNSFELAVWKILFDLSKLAG